MNEGSGNLRLVIDNDDCKKLRDSVRNMVTGVHGSAKVNADTPITVGVNSLSDLLTKSVADYHLKTSLQAVNLVQQICISDKDGSVLMDLNLLFQRLTAVLLRGKNNDNQINLSNLFSYPFCAYPA